uniref:Uncharacterized protein n=1 Tax=Nothoprocta perdicaria TaxID=30464 RepID=A0A8C6Z0F9_NOTPE
MLFYHRTYTELGLSPKVLLNTEDVRLSGFFVSEIHPLPHHQTPPSWNPALPVSCKVFDYIHWKHREPKAQSE